MKTRPMATAGLAWAMFLASCMSMPARAGTPRAAGAAADRVFFESSLDGAKPAVAFATLWERQEHRKLTYDETMDMAMALFLQQHWEEAAGVYKSAAANTLEPNQKAAAITGAAQNLAATQKWSDAGQLMNEANRLLPNSKIVVALRYTYWKNADDAMQTMIAQDRMKQLDLASDGKVVCLGLHDVPLIIDIGEMVFHWLREKRPPTLDELTQVGPEVFVVLCDVVETVSTTQVSP